LTYGYVDVVPRVFLTSTGTSIIPGFRRKDENSLLEAELRLASRGVSYIVLDLRTESDSVPGRISLKNRGIVLREFDVERIRYRRAKGLFMEPIPLIKKKAFFPLKRKEIKPWR
jgi:hypothetical protein